MSELKKTKDNIAKVSEILEKIKEKTPLEKEMEILTQLPEFYDTCPFLVKRMCRGEDMKMLDVMFNSIEKIHKGEATLAGTELQLGEELAQKFIYPQLSKEQIKKSQEACKKAASKKDK